MNRKNRVFRILSVLIFSVGVLIGMVLFGIIVWPDLEAVLFDVTMRGDARLTSLKCPVMIASDEISTVSATFENTLDRPVEYMIRAHISQYYLTVMSEITSKLPLEPGESGKLEWVVDPEDAVYGRLILVRVRVGPKYPLPSRYGTCGIFVIGLPFLSGNQAFALILATSLLGMLGGAGLWVVTHRPLVGIGREVIGAMGALIVSVLIGIVLSLLGQWLLGVVIFAINVLLIGVILGFFVNRLGKGSL